MWHRPVLPILFFVPWTYLISPTPWPFISYFLYTTILSFLSLLSSYKNTLWWSWTTVVVVARHHCPDPFSRGCDSLSEPLGVVSADSPQLISVLAVAPGHAKLPCPRSCLLPRGSPCRRTDYWRNTEAHFRIGTILKAIPALESPLVWVICSCDCRIVLFFFLFLLINFLHKNLRVRVCFLRSPTCNSYYSVQNVTFLRKKDLLLPFFVVAVMISGTSDHSCSIGICWFWLSWMEWRSKPCIFIISVQNKYRICY